MARNHKRKTAEKRIKGTVNNRVRSEARPSRREDPEREAAARRIYADEESILKADAADEGADGTGKRPAVHEGNGTKRTKKNTAASRPVGKSKKRRPGKSETARSEIAGAKRRKTEKSEANRAESAGTNPRKRRESGTSFENTDSELLKSSSSRSGSSEETGVSAASAKTGEKNPEKFGSAKRGLEKSAKANVTGKSSAGTKSKKSPEKRTEVSEAVKASEKRGAGTVSKKTPEKCGAGTVSKNAPEKRDAGTVSKKTPEKRDAGTVSKKTPEKRGAGTVSKKAPEKRGAGTVTKKIPEKRTGISAAAGKPLKMPSGEALIREFRQAVHFDKKVFAGVLCAIVIVSIVLINVTELEGITRLPLTDISAGHDALANQMMKDLTEETQAISAIEDAERAEAEAAERAAMDEEAYEAQLAAQQAAYDAAHGDDNDLLNTMTVRDPDELRVTLAENNAYAIGDSMIEGMNDGQYVNTENLIFRRGCGTYDSLELFERAVNLQASVVWVQLGLNDMDMYITDVGQFKDNYRKLVLYLQENLPDCRIFLCNINPISPDACRRHPQYEYAGQYNQAIMELCEELGVTYVDNTTLILGHPELWDTDGIHPVQDVYLWILSHMCYEAGI